MLNESEICGLLIASRSGIDLAEATVNVSNLVFTTTDWDTPQTVTVTGVDDAIDDDDQTTVITVSVVDGASDDAFDGLADHFGAPLSTWHGGHLLQFGRSDGFREIGRMLNRLGVIRRD